MGRMVIDLNISHKSAHKSRRNRNSPFSILDHSSRLFSNCQNIVEIHLSTMYTFYILNSLENIKLPKLEVIDVCWKSCPASPSLRHRFYGANFNHKTTIKCICIPGNANDRVELYVAGEITPFTKENYFASFNSLEKITYQE